MEKKKLTFKKVISIILGLVFVLAVVFGIGYLIKSNSKESEVFLTRKPSIKNLDDKVMATGRIEPREEIEIKQSLTLTNGNHWYRTAYSSDNEIGKGFRAEDLDLVQNTPSSPGNQLPATPTQPPTGNTGTNPPSTPKPEVPKQETVKLDAESTTLLQDVSKLIKELIALLKNIFNRG